MCKKLTNNKKSKRIESEEITVSLFADNMKFLGKLI